MLDTIFITNPITLAFLAAVLILHIISRFLHSPVWLTVINITVHIAAMIFFIFAGASLKDILCLLLISVAAGLWQSGKETKQ